MTKEQRLKKQSTIANNCYDLETKKYILFNCKKGCKFYDDETGCSKKRVIRICAKKGLKNKE